MRNKIFLLIGTFFVLLVLFVPNISEAAVTCVSPCKCIGPTEICSDGLQPDSGKTCANEHSTCCCPSGDGLMLQNPLTSDKFEDILDNVIDFIFNIAIVLVPLMIVIAGFLFVTAGGNAEQINKAKTMIIWTAIGFLIILLSKGIMGIIINLLGVG